MPSSWALVFFWLLCLWSLHKITLFWNLQHKKLNEGDREHLPATHAITVVHYFARLSTQSSPSHICLCCCSYMTQFPTPHTHSVRILRWEHFFFSFSLSQAVMSFLIAVTCWLLLFTFETHECVCLCWCKKKCFQAHSTQRIFFLFVLHCICRAHTLNCGLTWCLCDWWRGSVETGDDNVEVRLDVEFLACYTFADCRWPLKCICALQWNSFCECVWWSRYGAALVLYVSSVPPLHKTAATHFCGSTLAENVVASHCTERKKNSIVKSSSVPLPTPLPFFSATFHAE